MDWYPVSSRILARSLRVMARLPLRPPIDPCVAEFPTDMQSAQPTRGLGTRCKMVRTDRGAVAGACPSRAMPHPSHAMPLPVLRSIR